MNWKSFKYKSKGATTDYYYHWLPENQEVLLPTPLPSNGKELPEYYEEFDTLAHCTTFENAAIIVKQGFQPQCVSDSSVVNSDMELLNFENGEDVEPRIPHPINDQAVLWYGPTTFEKVQERVPFERYGNVGFIMNQLYGYEGIIRGEDGLKLYFIEVIEYLKKTACRIFVTTKTYPELKSYNPYKKGGPLYIAKGEYYYLKSIRCHDGTIKPNVVEFMKDISTHKQRHFENHMISFSYCNWPRRGVEVRFLRGV